MPKFEKTVCDIEEREVEIAVGSGIVRLLASSVNDFTPTQARRVAIAIQRAALVAEREEASK